MFHMYDKKCKSVTSHAPDPLPMSQTVTPSRTPSPLERDVLYGRPQNHRILDYYRPTIHVSGAREQSLNIVLTEATAWNSSSNQLTYHTPA